MQKLENNAFFWQKIDSLYLSSDFNLAIKKGSYVADFPDTPFPCDLGFLKTMKKEKNNNIYCFKGNNPREVEQIIIAADLLEKKFEVYLCAGLTADEIENVLHYLNQSDSKKTIMVARTNEDFPGWAYTED